MEFQFKFDKTFQQGIIALMVEDTIFGQKAASYLDPKYFTNSHIAFFFSAAQKLIAEYEYVSWSMMEAQVLNFTIDKREEYAQILHQIKNPQLPRDTEFIRNNLEKFTKKAVAYHINEKLVKAQQKDPDKIISLIEKDLEELKHINFQKTDMMTLGQAERLMEESSQQSEQVLALGLPDIDDALGGGIPRETLTLAIGGTNVGKSLFLINAAYNFLKEGHKVFMVNLEGERKQAMLRLIARSTQLPYGRIRTHSLNDKERERVHNVAQQYKDNLLMKHIGEFNYTIEDFYTLCRDVYKDFQFDAVVLDYGQLMSSKQRFNSIRERQMYVHRGLSSIASVHNSAVLTVAQGTRDAQAKNNQGQYLRMTDISECFELCRVASTVLTLNRSEEDEVNNKVQILLDKQRDGKKGILQSCYTNMEWVGLYGSDLEGLGFITDEQGANPNLPGEAFSGTAN